MISYLSVSARGHSINCAQLKKEKKKRNVVHPYFIALFGRIKKSSKANVRVNMFVWILIKNVNF